MFTKLAADITFSDIEDFCREFGEGVRVEYKQEIQHIPKIVSSFANTLGGIFIIGAETDENNKVKFPIQGIPNRGRIEEQIQESALNGIYPAVIPEVIICDVPNTNNVVVIIRVDESVEAPHAIQNSTRVYIRIGSITQPYKLELAEIDRIEYMLKRRGDSQVTARQIFNRAEERTESLFATNRPNITAITRPVFPYRPLIATEKIRDFARHTGFINNPTGARAAGGMVDVTRGDIGLYDYWEYNEYGIAYRRKSLDSSFIGSEEEYLDFWECVAMIGRFIDRARYFYKECAYLGAIEIAVQLRHIFDKKLSFHRIVEQLPGVRWTGADTTEQRCIDSEIRISTQRLAHCLEGEEFINVLDELTSQLLWAFNVDATDMEREKVIQFILGGEWGWRQ